MLEFDRNRFAELLMAVPEKNALLAETTESPYIRSLLEQFENDGAVDLTMIDLDAFELEHVTPVGYEKAYNHVTGRWLKGFVQFCRNVPPLALQQRSFF